MVFVRLYKGGSRLDAVVEDSRFDKRRLIEYRWNSKLKSDTPPANWYKAVMGEVEFQRSQDLKAATGRVLPGDVL